MAQSSDRVAGLADVEAALPLRSIAAVGMVDLAVLLLRASAVFLLLSPVLILLLAFS